ncbi:MAG: hypothetical protein WBC33_07615 [Conexibacter sp.]
MRPAGADRAAVGMILAIHLSALTVFYIGCGVCVVAVVVALLGLRLRAASVPDTPAEWGTTADDRVWDAEAGKAVHGTLATIRTAATAWGSTVGTLLGVFGIAAFVKGPETFTDIDGAAAPVAALIVLLAAVVAAAAVWLAALAAQGVPAEVAQLDGFALKTLSAQRARTAAHQLAASRLLTLVAALLVLVSIGLVWLTALDQRDAASAPASAVLVPEDGGAAVCGKLARRGTTLVVAPASGAPVVVRDDAALTVVDACP